MATTIKVLFEANATRYFLNVNLPASFEARAARLASVLNSDDWTPEQAASYYQEMLAQTALEYLGGEWESSDGSDACWLWRGLTKPSGRELAGQFTIGERNYLAHRLIYEYVHGRGDARKRLRYVVHTCGNSLCVNPLHMKRVTLREWGLLVRARHETCARGHAWAEHGRVDGQGRRYCRLCKLERLRADPKSPWKGGVHNRHKTTCKNGHDIANPENYTLSSRNQRNCKLCVRLRYERRKARLAAERARGKRGRKKA